MKRLFSILMFGALGFAALLSALPAQAQLPLLDMLITPASQIAAPGDAPSWSVQLTNNTTDTAFFTLTGFNDGLIITPDITVQPYDPTPFGVNYTLAPNDSLTLTDLFQTTVSPTAAGAVYTSTAEMDYDLYDDNTFSNFLADGLIASNDWELTVQPAVGPTPTPEPSTLALFGSPALLGTICYFRRRRRRKA